jgi:monothiol glutaredoxin
MQILRTMDAPFESVNILENEALRSGMKEYSQWPTFPQVSPHPLLTLRLLISG